MFVKFIALAALVCILTAAASCAAEEKIQLPEPVRVRDGGVTLLQALNARQSGRDFDSEADFTQQELANLLWATAGINREDGRLVYPTALDVRDVLVYVFTRECVYLFDPVENSLALIAEGDHREDTGMQPFVKDAAVNLAYVQDLARWEVEGKPNVPDESKRLMGAAHVGAAMQNANLYAAAQGWSAVVRGSFKEKTLRELMKLNDKQSIVLVQSIGPAVK